MLKRKADQSCVALVVGNSAYAPGIGKLTNPVNDADDTAASLEHLGFTVTKVVNADRITFQQAVEKFGKNLIGKQAACFYYAGHGMQAEGENYLLPLGEELNNEHELQFKAINAGFVLAQMEAAKCPINLVVLDACRDNPLAKAGRTTVRGLAQVQGPAGSLIVYATAAGKTAQDGNGRNGVFTSAFLKHLATPGQDIDLFLRVVSGEVQQSTSGKQIPWRSSNLTQGFCFVPAPTAAELEAERKVRGQLLGTLEAQQAEMNRQRKAEEAVMLAKQAEITEMEEKIKAAQAKMNAGGVGSTAGDLDAIVAMVDAKEQQAAELAALRRKADEARQAREAELAQLTAQDKRHREAALEIDLAKYRKIAKSSHGSEMKDAAWAAILRKWNVSNIEVGDESELAFRVFPDKPAAVAAAAAAATAADRAFADGGRPALEAFVTQYPQHTRAAEARRQIAMIPPWASGVGKDQYGTWAQLAMSGQRQIMRLIPTGTFTRENGSVVTLSPFWLGDSAVTQGFWQATMGNNPSHFTGDLNRPVEQVSWVDCQRFFTILNGQVRGMTATFPTEAQWEYACRTGTIGDYSGDLNAMAWYIRNSGRKTHPVKTKAANAWGLYDMHGNVWQWCADRYGEYPSGAVTDPVGPATGSFYVNRGGCWSGEAWSCRSAFRGRDQNDHRSNSVGFRICAQATP